MKPLLFLILLPLVDLSAQAQKRTAPASQLVWINQVAVQNKVNVLVVDYVTMLTGSRAVKAAREAGDAEFEDKHNGDTTWYVPNDFYIENKSRKLRTLPVADSCAIQLIRVGGTRLYKSDLAQLKKGYAGNLYRLEIVLGKIVKLTEVYTP
ncbi:hypothetical protein [Niabella sp.]|uniref:hypothetical protein n=1 Tax=Niabella sp. TaxID=1962976 RepID=UPI00260CE204|nr:hypothetical protein [Niabella sp.]